MKVRTKKQRGIVSVEFAIGFFSFWLMVGVWVEASYISYVSALGDYAVSEASRAAKKDTETYVDTFKATLSRSDSAWSHIVSADNFRASVTYVKDLDSLYNLTATNNCVPPEGSQTATCGDAENLSALAVYYVDYQVDSYFSYLFNSNSLFAREVIVVQEYERENFQFQN